MFRKHQTAVRNDGAPSGSGSVYWLVKV